MKMLHEAQRTSAPSACSVSISTAVWMVMCSEPAMRAPLSGLLRRVFGDKHFLAPPVGKGQFGDLKIVTHLRFFED
jgi:hypothetical protein